MGVSDPHCHTTASDGMVSPRQLVRSAVALGLDLIAVCDHDTMIAAAETQACGEEVGLAVVAGQEVTTRWPAQTHVVGWFLEKPVKSGQSLAATVDAIQAQGGLAILPHPFMPTYFASCQPEALVSLLTTHRLDGIELIHTAPLGAGRRRRLERFCADHRDRVGALIGASDSHFGSHDLGRALTEFPGRTAADFHQAVLERRTVPRRGRRASVPAGDALRQQWRSLVDLPLRRLLGQFE